MRSQNYYIFFRKKGLISLVLNIKLKKMIKYSTFVSNITGREKKEYFIILICWSLCYEWRLKQLVKAKGAM
jgi:hypothetical protein